MSKAEELREIRDAIEDQKRCLGDWRVVHAEPNSQEATHLITAAGWLGMALSEMTTAANVIRIREQG